MCKIGLSAVAKWLGTGPIPQERNMVWRREAEIGTISPLARNRDTIRNRMAEVGEVFFSKTPGWSWRRSLPRG